MIKKKLTKEQKSVLIAMLLGDGTISNNYVFKLSHNKDQLEYLQWKINLLNSLHIKNNGIKEYTSSCGYNVGKNVIYSQLSIIPLIKVLRRCVYKPTKIITRKLLNWLDERGIAIWYMDDGCINVNTSIQRSSIQYTIKFATCCDKNTALMIIEYFKEKWNINFRLFSEGKNSFSIATCSKQDCLNFVQIVKPYLLQVPSLLYKIRSNYTKEVFLNNPDARDIL